jgi:hypothetical protein
MKAINLTIDTYTKSIAIRMAVADRIKTLSELLSNTGLSDEVKAIFGKDLAELESMHKQLNDWD